MACSRTFRLIFVVLAVLTVILMPAHTASAADQTCAPGAWCFPAGTACPGFGLQIQFEANAHKVCQEYRDVHDDTVHVFGPGAGSTLTLTNLASGATLTVPPADATIRIMLNPDDSCTHVARGAYAVVHTPVHRGSAPEALLYSTQLVYTVEPGWFFTLRSAGGEPRDICAALSGS
jgi:hypothetical protein